MCDSEISALLEEFAHSAEYLELRQRYKSKMRRVPKPRAGLVVSGSEVVASKKTRAEVMRRHPTALGLEMEIYAIYTAALAGLGKKSEFIAISVADFADPEKTDAIQKIASRMSAILLKYLLAKSLNCAECS
jgi:nucleoside phosphorylase